MFRRGTILTASVANIETQNATRNSNSDEDSSDESEVIR